MILKDVQLEYYAREIECLKHNRNLPASSPIVTLSPVLDEFGILRVGGRLNKLKNSSVQAQYNPVIVPGAHHVTTLLVRHHHALVKHQGRHITEGAVRSADFWIVGGKRLIKSIIYNCVKCRRLRRTLRSQKMSDLPVERLTPSPPFTFVGVDTFGPWTVASRRTRGGLAHSKRWAVLFTCFAIRAIHIEVVDDMSSSAFINALRRFISLRGPVQELYSDRGTNFIGCTDDMKIDTINVEDGPVKEYLYNRGVTWKFNSPHSSHMGGVWERMIGLTRRILDSMLQEHCNKNLTHDVLVTLMYEICAIVNSRPIVSVSTDPESAEILSPSTLLNHKCSTVAEPFEELEIKDMYRAHWKQVQVLANIFWDKWKKEYLYTLQKRSKWTHERDNVKIGDVVLLKDKSLPRIQWSIGRVMKIFPGEDNLVRKVEVKTLRGETPVRYTRPITELVSLLSE
jgi:transposase InsO family protein